MGKSTAVIKAEPADQTGQYHVIEASEKGLQHIRATTREEFNGLLTLDERLQGRRILVNYPEGPVKLEPR
jgi:hypothetical protein